MSPVLPQTPPPELELSRTDKMESSLFDSDVRMLLRRSICQTLEHVGFDRATEEALEAMCAEVDTCLYILTCGPRSLLLTRFKIRRIYLHKLLLR